MNLVVHTGWNKIGGNSSRTMHEVNLKMSDENASIGIWNKFYLLDCPLTVFFEA